MVFSTKLALSLCSLLTVQATLAGSLEAQLHNEQFTFRSSDAARLDRFGDAVDIDGNLMVIGATRVDDNGGNSGAAYLFDASTGIQLAKFLPSDGAADDRFGFAVAIDAGVVAVGSIRDDDNGSDSGAVYLFDVTSGLQIAKLVANDGAAGFAFGSSLAMNMGLLAIGAPNGSKPGKAYLYDVNTASLLRPLIPEQASVPGFGISIDMDASSVVVGAWGPNFISGSARSFEIATGNQLASFFPGEPRFREGFGQACAIENGVLAVGAYGAGTGSFSGPGMVFLFDALGGQALGNLKDPNGIESDQFGSSVAMQNGIVAVGARKASIFLFEAASRRLNTQLRPSSLGNFSGFGNNVAMDAGYLAAGAPDTTQTGVKSGVSYSFNLQAIASAPKLGIQNLVAGEQVQFMLSGGQDGSAGLIVFGMNPGTTQLNGLGGFNALLGIQAINPASILPGSFQRFDGTGVISLSLHVPISLAGLSFYFQGMQQGTAQGQSNLLQQTVN